MAAMAAVLFATVRRTRWSLLKRCYCSVSTAQQTEPNPQTDVTKIEEPSIPMVPKTRDPTAVLKALASTVEPTEYEMLDGMGPADPMYPLSKLDRLMYVKHQDAGRKAADYVLRRWPQMFKLKKLDSDPLEESEKDLQYFISRHRAGKAMREYNKLKEKEESIPLETKNEVLTLAAFFGLQSPYVPSREKGHVYSQQKDFSWWTGSRRSGGTHEPEVTQVSPREEAANDGATEEDGAAKENNDKPLSMTRIEGGVRIWSMDNLAERLFREDFEEKNAQTYEAMIQGLVKYKNFKRAFQLFDEMRSLDYQAQSSTYNLLLSAMTDLDGVGPSMWATSQILLQHMNSDPKVAPNTETFDILLQISFHHPKACEISLKVLREMLHLGVEPSLSTFHTILKVFGINGKSHCIVEEIVAYLESNPSIIRIQGMDCFRFFGLAMTACVDVPNAEAGTKLLHLYTDYGNSGLLDYKVGFMSNYIKLLCANESLDQVMEEYKRLVPSAFVPYEWLYGSLFKLANNEKRIDVLEQLWKDMKRFNVRIQSRQTVQVMSNLIYYAFIPYKETEKYMTILDSAVRELIDVGESPTRKILTCLLMLAHKLQSTEKAWEYYKFFDTITDTPTLGNILGVLRCHQQPVYKDRVLHLLDRMVALRLKCSRRIILDVCKKTGIDFNTCNVFVRKIAMENQNSEEEVIYEERPTTSVMGKAVGMEKKTEVPVGREEVKMKKREDVLADIVGISEESSSGSRNVREEEMERKDGPKDDEEMERKDGPKDDEEMERKDGPEDDASTNTVND